MHPVWKRRHWILSVLFCSLFSGLVSGQDCVELKDIPYVEDGGIRQQFDLYLPVDYQSRNPLPTLLAIHGGGWTDGDKKDVAFWAREFVSHGYAVVAVNYRFQPKDPMPAQIIDCKSAIRYLRAHAEKYNLDKEHFGAWGHSAGGHLAALLGVSGDWKELKKGEHLNQSDAIQAASSFCGPTNFVSWFHKEPLSFFVGLSLFEGPMKSKVEWAQKMSPALNVTETSAPILIVHAVDDELVPLAQSQELHDAMQKAKLESRLIELQAGEGGHVSTGFFSDQTKKSVREFFDKILMEDENKQPTTIGD